MLIVGAVALLSLAAPVDEVGEPTELTQAADDAVRTPLSQESTAQDPDVPGLDLVFRDEFATDTSAHYEINGDVEWTPPGRLVFGESGSLRRQFEGSTWVRLELEAVFPEVIVDPPKPALRVSFHRGGAADFYVQFTRTRDGASVALVDSGGKVDRVLKQTPSAPLQSGSMTVEYRRGLVSVTSARETVLLAYLARADTPVTSMGVDMPSGARLESLATLALEEKAQAFSAQEKQQLADAKAANAKLVQLYRSGKPEQAVAPGERALQIRRSVLGVHHPDYASSLNNLAVLYKHLGDYARAERIYRQAMDVNKTILGRQHPRYANSLNNLAALFRDLGDLAQSETLYLQALDIRERVLGPQHPSYATSLNNLAVLYTDRGDFAQAEPLYRQAMEINRSRFGERHAGYANSLNNLAVLYKSMGDYARAAPLYEQALQIRKTVLGERHPSYANSLNNLAELRRVMGDYARSEPLYREAMEITKETRGDQHPDYASTVSSLAVLYENMGEPARAEPLYRLAIDIERSVLGERHPSYAGSLNNLAGLHSRQGDYGRAEELYEQALEVLRSSLGDQHPRYASTLTNIAVLHERSGEDREATPLYRQALAIVRRNLNDSAVVQSERQQKRNQTAERGYLDSRIGNALRVGLAAGPVIESVWRWKGAVTRRQQAYRQVASTPRLAPIFASLQSVSRRLSALSGRFPQSPSDGASKDTRASWSQQRRRWDADFTRLSREREELEQQIAADSVAFRTLGNPLTVTMVRRRLPPKTAFVDFVDYRHTSRGDRQEVAERHYVAFVVRSDRDPQMLGLGRVKVFREAITDLRRPLTGGSASLARSVQAAASLRNELWLPLEEHLDGIDTVIISPDTALGTLPFAALPGAEPGSYLIEQFKFASLPLAAMLDSLLDRKRQRQPEKGLLVVGDVDYDADGASTEPPTKTDSGPEWMRRSAPRGRDSRWRSLSGFQQELAIVRDQFESRFGGGVTTLRRVEATEARFIEEAARHYNLHLITHGFFADPALATIAKGRHDAVGESTPRIRLGGNAAINQYVPGLLSGVVLAGANNPPPVDRPQADGILTATEIETLDLNAVDLVVLSACDTGLGKSAGGEGLTGLQRAFHIAGARSVVASLWDVDDRATLELMSRFYRYYWAEGRSKIDSLRQAQLDLLNDRSLTRGDPQARTTPPVSDGRPSKANRTDPRYWAAFTLSGDWR